MSHKDMDYYTYIRHIYHWAAPFYDLSDIVFSGLREKVVDLAAPEKGSRILDVATGTGKQAFAFAKRGFDVVGVDLSEDMLSVARRKKRFDNVSLQICDASNLPFKDDSFDVCTVSFGLHDMPSHIRQRVVKEMVRVTRPGGTVIVVDHSLPEKGFLRSFIYQYTKLYEGRYYPDFIRSDLKTLLRKSGIEIEQDVRLMLGGVRILKGINNKISLNG